MSGDNPPPFWAQSVPADDLGAFRADIRHGAQIEGGMGAESGDQAVSDADFAELLRFRDALRRFLHWSEGQARQAGLTPAQHQLLLAVRGHGGEPTIGDLAEHLMLRHHSTVELVDRAERAGLVHRRADPDDHRVVRLALSRDGARHLAALSAAHLAELHRLQHGLRLPSLAG